MEYKILEGYLNNEDKAGAVNYSLNALKNQEIMIPELYQEMLIPALNNMFCSENDISICIWKEHFRTSVVRTILECCYPLIVLKAKAIPEKNKKKLLIFCPEEEYHDLGARMISDYFMLCGHQSFYIGGNTPSDVVVKYMAHLKPDAVAIGVSNYYNLVNAKKTIKMIRKKTNEKVKIFLGGRAFFDNRIVIKEFEADSYLSNFNDVLQLCEGWDNDEVII